MITDTDINKMKKIFITKEDLKRELKDFVTKEDLKNAFTDSESGLNKRIDRVVDSIDYRFERFEKLEKDFRVFKDFTTRTLDWLVGSFKKFEEELIVMNYQSKRVLDRLENHETRITKLEEKPAFQ